MSGVGDVITGPVTDPPKQVAVVKNQREVELYKNEPPLTINEKFPITFQVQQKCGFKGASDTKKCEMKLLVHRVKNRKNVRDDNEQGGQLEYDEKDVHQYLQCPRHGPFPSGPEMW
jgi:hypothetical protein